MGRAKPIPTDADAIPSQSMPPPKPKRIKKAQPKAKAVEAEDSLPISKLAESKKTSSAPAKKSAETQPSESTQSKKPRSSSATTSKSKVPNVPWTPEITLEDKPVMATDSADDINVGVALSTTLLLPGDLEKNAGMSEYENYAFMLQHRVQAVQHAHSFSMQSFENKEKLTDLQKEYSALQKINKGLQAKMKKLEDQAEAATKAQTLAEEKAEAAEAVKKVAEAQKNEAEDKATQAEKELQEALATKKAEIKEADEKAYAQGMANVTEEYKLQVRQACNRGFSLGWMSLLKRLDLPADSPFRNADAIPLPFPPPSQSEDEFSLSLRMEMIRMLRP
ncbi:histone H1.10-like [Camellia sinensis]|uniref:histone H1.10-like n=1 Tax=Camellia sinensis TaxID=4442 RepID=UPI0010357C4A|nr:histone H1.10-like [Camellia sinensis]